MLVYSKKRYYPTLTNTLVIEDDSGFYYIHRSVYDMSVKLSIKQNYDSLNVLIDSEWNKEARDYWYHKVPAPINILAPFFGLVSEELELDLEKLAGVMHVITATVDVYRFIRVSKEMRKTVQFSLSVVNEYQMAWDAFKQLCIESPFQYAIPNQFMTQNQYPPVAANNLETQPQSQEQIESQEVTLDGYKEGDIVPLTVEDVKKDPNWQDLGNGIWYNATTDQCLCFEEDDATYQAEFDALTKEMLEQIEEQQEQQQEEERPQDILKKKMFKFGGCA